MMEIALNAEEIDFAPQKQEEECAGCQDLNPTFRERERERERKFPRGDEK